jgi:hypothetical protein
LKPLKNNCFLAKAGATVKASIFIGLLLLVCNVFAQEEGERLSNIDYNLELLLKNNENRLKTRSSEIIYYLIDTLDLPFVDDFSTNRFTYYHLPNYLPGEIIDRIAVNFLVNGQPQESVRYKRSQTYEYSFNQGANRVDSVATTPYNMEIFEFGQFPKNPYVPVESFQAWPAPFFRIEMVGGAPDTTEFIADGTLFLDTISHKIALVAPKNTLWIDTDVYINNSMAVNPPTIGVVTFDGLNQFGRAYVPGLLNVSNQRGIADHLTSKPINLSGLTAADSVYFSFYYQPQGTGNAPEAMDSLILEFFSPADTLWKWAWSAKGSAVQAFQQVMIPVGNPNFLQNGFQFRFKNYADLSGNLDHWHVDYIRLDRNRTRSNPLPYDIAFTQPANILLRNYKEMPWNQFVANPTAEMYDSLIVHIRNNSAVGEVVTLNHVVRNSNGANLFPVRLSSGPIPANTANTYRNRVNVTGFTFPTSPGRYQEFEVLNYIQAVQNDVNRNNDTLKHIQKFDNIYAYDDGVPEAAYGLNKQGAKLAYRFAANTPDKLTAVRIHFSPVNTQAYPYPFKLTIWSSLSPENIIYQDAGFSYPNHPNYVNGYVEYTLPEPVQVSGNFFVGMVQSNNVELNIGFDRSFDTKDRIFFNLNGSWQNTIFSGSLMIRPVLGPSNDPAVGIVEHQKPKQEQQLRVFPNPTRNKIFIEGITEFEDTSLSLYDLYGRKVVYLFEENITTVDVSGLAEGMYILKVENSKKGINHTSKIMVAR